MISHILTWDDRPPGRESTTLRFGKPPMSLAYVILGLLQQQDRTGYDLKTQCFDDCIAHLWQADQAQIYRTLDRLEAQGWIICTIEVQHDRPNRKVYRITPAGEAALLQWLPAHQPPPIWREPLLVQLYFAAQLSNAAIVDLLQQELTARQEKLADCERRSTTLPASLTARDQQMQQLALDLVKRREQAYIDWLSRTIETLQSSG